MDEDFLLVLKLRIYIWISYKIQGELMMKFNIKEDGKRIVIICLAAFMMALNIKSFVRTGGLYPGGATGLALLIQRGAKLFFQITLPYTGNRVDEDFLLVLGIRNGREDAAERFVRKYYSEILNYCFAKTGDFMQAEDITQQIFLNFFKNIGRYEHRGKAKNYLYVAAGNLCKNLSALLKAFY